MGRFVGSIGNNNAARLERIMDEKKRMIGIDKGALDAQVLERKAREAKELSELRSFAQQAVQMDTLLCSHHQANEQQRCALNQGIAIFQHLQADDKSQRQARERHVELAANMAEQQYLSTNPYLNEDPRVEQSALSPHRVRRDHWKGMSDEQLRNIQDTQAKQVADKARNQQEERLEQQAYASMHHNFVNVRSHEAAEVEAAKRQEAGRLANELQRQMLEKRGRDEYLAHLYTNPPQKSFFDQFGTSHR